jgi:undecaprenyl-diphosphatase
MASSRTTDVIRRFDAAELTLCLLLNRSCSRRSVREFFSVVSRLGNGIFWYVMILALPLMYGNAGLISAIQMALTGAAGVILYKVLKLSLVRERPFIRSAGISLGAAPLDRYSFPSGHTLHAVSFTTIAASHFPELALVLVPFAALVAASRMILGLHYPSDVIAGGLLGFALASVSRQILLAYGLF